MALAATMALAVILLMAAGMPRPRDLNFDKSVNYFCSATK